MVSRWEAIFKPEERDFAPPGPRQKLRSVRLPINRHICKDKKVGAAQAILMAKGQKQGS